MGFLRISLTGMKARWSIWILAAACPLFGCAAGLTREQRMSLDQGLDAYQQQHYAAAIDQLGDFLGEVADRPEVAQALYIRGLSHARRGERDEAYSDLHRSVAEPTATTETTWRAYLTLGTLYREDGRWRAGAESLQAAVTRMPDVAPKDTALWWLGLCRERSGDWPASRDAFAEILAKFPHGNYATAAQRRIWIKADHFAVQCGVFAVALNAEILERRLRGENLPAYTRVEPRRNGRRQVVLVGRLARYEDAVQQVAVVRKHVPDAVIWP